jgi:hypothetical protein
MGGANDVLQKYTEGYGGGKYTTALQGNFTGTCTVGIGSPNVTGVGTTFLTQYKIDDTIVLDTATTKVMRRVTQIVSDTSIVTHANYTAVLTATTHTQPVTQYKPYGIMLESAGGDHVNLAQGDYQNFVWFDSADRPKILRSSAYNSTVLPSADTDGEYFTHVLNRTSTQVLVANTVTETIFYTATVPANRLGLSGSLRLRLNGRILYNNGSANTLNLRVKYGASTLIASGALAIPGGLSAVRRAYVLEVYLMNNGATNSQKCMARMTGDTDTTTFDGSDQFSWHAYGTSATLSDADAVFSCTAQWGTASTNNSFEVEFATLELV